MNIPIVKYLTTHDMSTNSPAILIPLLPKPVVSQQLGVKVMRFKG